MVNFLLREVKGGIKKAVHFRCTASACRKSMFFQKSACSQSLSPLGHSVGFASCKAWCVLISASLPKTPSPFPVVKGCVCFVGSASCRAFGHTRPASLPGLSVGLPPLTKQGCLQSATQSHGTMQWHKWLTTCTGAPPLRPHFYQRYSFFDRLNVPQ